MCLIRLASVLLFLVSASVAWADGGAVVGEDDALSCAGGIAPSFRLRGLVETPQAFTLKTLKNYPVVQLDVAYYSGSAGLVTKTYRGASLWSLIDAAGLVTDSAYKNDQIRKYVVVTGSDCYQAVIALADILPDFGGEPVLVAYADGNGDELGDEGMARLVAPGDKKGGRYVSNIVRIEVRSAP